MLRSLPLVLLVLGPTLGPSLLRAQTSGTLVAPTSPRTLAPRSHCTPPGVERFLPSMPPYGRAGEDRFLAVTSEWAVFTITSGPAEEWLYVLHHVPTGINTGTGLQSHEIRQSGAFSPSGTVFFQGVFEGSAHTDFNGDGDDWDVVLFVFDLQTWTTTNTGIAIGLEMSDTSAAGTVLFPVAETVDENGDGDTDDWIAYAGDLTTNTIVSSGIATSSDFRNHFWLEGKRAAWLVEEEPGIDYTGDGDTVDEVYFVYDFALGFGVNLGLATGRDATLADGVFAFTVDELAQGTDLDGDGTADDRVLFTFDFETGALTNVGEAALHPVIGADRVGFQHQETGTFHLVDLVTGAVVDSGLVLGARPTFVDGHFVAGSLEQTVDWNGDGDTEDHVLWFHEPASGDTFHLGVATTPGPSYAPPWFRWMGSSILVVQVEADQGHTDLNGDGDALDEVWSLVSADTGVVRSLRLAAPPVNRIAGGLFDGFAALGVDELAQGTDLDGDGSLYSDPWVTLCLGEPTVPPRLHDGRLVDSPRFAAGLGWWALTVQDPSPTGGGPERSFLAALLED